MVSPAPNPKGGTYLLYGKEAFLKREFIQNLRAELFQNSQDREMGFRQFEIPKDSLSSVFDFTGSPSFFSSKRMAVLSGIDSLEEEDKERLLAYAGQMPPGAALVLVTEESNVKKDHFLRKFAEKARPIPCHLPFDKDLPQWVEARARKFGKTMDREAISVLIERAGKDAALLHSAVEQLAVYTREAARISAKDVETLLGRSVQADVFGLLDALLEKKIKSALEILENSLNEGARIYEIVGAFSGQLERLSKIRALTDEGFPREAIAEELKLHPFFSAKVLKQAERLSQAELQRLLKNLLACDEAVKTGKLNDRLALQRFILQTCLDVT